MKAVTENLHYAVKNVSGSIVLEFAIVFPVFLALLLSIVSISRVSVAHSALQQSAISLSFEFSDYSEVQQQHITASLVLTRLVELGTASFVFDLDNLNVTEAVQSTSSFKVFEITQTFEPLSPTLELPILDYFTSSSFFMYVPLKPNYSND